MCTNDVRSASANICPQIQIRKLCEGPLTVTPVSCKVWGKHIGAHTHTHTHKLLVIILKAGSEIVLPNCVCVPTLTPSHINLCTQRLSGGLPLFENYKNGWPQPLPSERGFQMLLDNQTSTLLEAH